MRETSMSMVSAHRWSIDEMGGGEIDRGIERKEAM